MEREQKLLLLGVCAIVFFLAGGYALTVYLAGMKLGFYSGRWMHELFFGFLVVLLLIIWGFFRVYSNKGKKAVPA